jgi:hypothetical protein
MAKQNSIHLFLDLLSQFSIVKKSHHGKRLAYSIPNLLDGEIPDLELLKKLTEPYKIKILNDTNQEIVLIF